MKRNGWWGLLACGLVTLGLVPQGMAESASAPPFKAGSKWIYNMTNFARREQTDALIALMHRAKAAGYTGMVVSDVKFDKFQLATPEILANVRRFREATRASGMDFITAVAPFGYADMMLSNDPNLAEGMPVRDAAFVVKDGALVPVEESLQLINGGLEEWKKGMPVGWSVDDPGVISFQDAQAHGGQASVRQQDPSSGGRGRLSQKIAVKPWHFYHLSAWIKTEGTTSKDWRLCALGNGRVLNWQSPRLEPTQDWKQYHATFCSLDNTEVTVMLGCWGGKAGKVWFDDLQIEPGGFVNVIRRDSLPLKVTSADGQTVYQEGVDFAAVVDPKLGADPNPGYFSNWHEPPVVRIPAGSKLKEGDRVLASYHFASTCGKPNNINMCMSEPKTYTIIERQIKWMREHAQPDGYMMSHDEIRLNGWDDTCAATGKTTGQILADNVSRCAAIIKQVDPGKPIAVWSDMFDPTHNARETDKDGKPFVMYMTKGTSAGSWEGLPKDVAIVNWSGGNLESCQFFANRGHQQILSGNRPGDIKSWLKDCKALPGIAGMMYTTWTDDFGPVVEEYAGAAKSQEVAAQPARP